MIDLDSVRQRLKNQLSQLSLERLVGIGGLAAFSAVSAFALINPAAPNFVDTLSQWLGSLGLNVLASVLVNNYQYLLSQPGGDEAERVTQLARSLEPVIKRDPKLRSEIGVFLNNIGTLEIAQEVVNGNPTVHGWLLFKIYSDIVVYRNDFDQIHKSLTWILTAVEQLQQSHLFLRPFILPPLPSVFLGRAEALTDLKARLGITSSGPNPTLIKVQTIVRGWPGVGKTTLTTVLAYDPDIISVFPDGVLWASLGPAPHMLSELVTWGRALGSNDLLRARTLEEAQTQLTSLLRNKRMLLIVDDVFEVEHAIAFNVGGPGCAMLITTRLPMVAELLDPTFNEIYVLKVLSDPDALEILKTITPTVVQRYLKETGELVHELEGLPLALHVAGRLLNVEMKLEFSIIRLIEDLRKGARLLEAKAPKDRTELEKQTLPTVAALLQKSTDLLDSATRDCYAFLGVFAPKPATFDLEAMKAVWGMEDPKPMVRKLVDRGLLEPVPSGRFQLHALLVMHAKSLLTKE